MPGLGVCKVEERNDSSVLWDFQQRGVVS
eukprot:COSAG04_NODE_10012_length_813_cov_0.864146_1_plen_28_part_01